MRALFLQASSYESSSHAHVPQSHAGRREAPAACECSRTTSAAGSSSHTPLQDRRHPTESRPRAPVQDHRRQSTHPTDVANEPSQPAQEAHDVRVIPDEEVNFGIVSKTEFHSMRVEIHKTAPASNVLLCSVRVRDPEQGHQQRSRQTR
jgi:hypothetical protein